MRYKSHAGNPPAVGALPASLCLLLPAACGRGCRWQGRQESKVLQKRQSISINRQDVSTCINTQMDSLIPPSKISGLTQGMFVGAVSDNFDERIEQKIFHAEIVVDNAKVAAETKAYKPIPVITDFTDKQGNDCMKEKVQESYNRIRTR